MELPPICDCLEVWQVRGKESILHAERQDTSLPAWKRLEELIEQGVEQRAEVFSPGPAIGREDWLRIITLPPSIGRLKSVKTLDLYGSSLVRLPPEIGDMESLELFDPYTSYCLHWFPWEITRCTRLRRSRVSTRALYGNYKNRLPFPDLRTEENRAALELALPPACSVCRGEFDARGPMRRWISMLVGTDVLPLLVHACSPTCLDALPQPPENYLPKPHQGGRSLEQPPRL